MTPESEHYDARPERRENYRSAYVFRISCPCTMATRRFFGKIASWCISGFQTLRSHGSLIRTFYWLMKRNAFYEDYESSLHSSSLLSPSFLRFSRDWSSRGCDVTKIRRGKYVAWKKRAKNIRSRRNVENIERPSQNATQRCSLRHRSRREFRSPASWSFRYSAYLVWRNLVEIPASGSSRQRNRTCDNRACIPAGFRSRWPLARKYQAREQLSIPRLPAPVINPSLGKTTERPAVLSVAPNLGNVASASVRAYFIARLSRASPRPAAAQGASRSRDARFSEMLATRAIRRSRRARCRLSIGIPSAIGS